MVLGGFGSFWVVLGGFGWFRVLVTTSYVFLRRRRRFTSRTLYACLGKFICFLQLSDRAKFLELDVQGSFSFDS